MMMRMFIGGCIGEEEDDVRTATRRHVHACA